MACGRDPVAIFDLSSRLATTSFEKAGEYSSGNLS